MVPNCFTEQPDILVKLPDESQLAETPIAMLGYDEFQSEESYSAGGVWMLTGAALVAVGGQGDGLYCARSENLAKEETGTRRSGFDLL